MTPQSDLTNEIKLESTIRLLKKKEKKKPGKELELLTELVIGWSFSLVPFCSKVIMIAA